MKTKEEWCQERSFINPVWMKQFIAAIQHDAQRAAYEECAEIVAKHTTKNNVGYADAILTARNNLPKP